MSVKLSPTSPDGFIAFSHCGDDWRDLRDHVRHKLGLPSDGWKRERTDSPKARPKAEAPIAPADGDAERIASAVSLWRASVDPRGTHAERYLNGRNLELTDDIAGEVLRWHPGVGAMVALFRNIESGRPQAVSRTFLDRDGRKTGRKFMGPVAGGAVMLDPHDAVLGGLHVGEGIETCLTARQWSIAAHAGRSEVAAQSPPSRSLTASNA